MMIDSEEAQQQQQTAEGSGEQQTAAQELDAWLEGLIQGSPERADWRRLYRSIDDKTDARLEELLGEVKEGDREALLARIQSRRQNLPLKPEQTDKVLDICKQLLAFGVAGLSLAVAFMDKAKELPVAGQKALAIGGLFYIELLLVALASLCVYLLTARFRYAFLFLSKISNAWPFFYYGSIDPRVDISLLSNVLVRPRSMVKNGALFAKDSLKLTGRVIAEDKSEELRNELQQYCVLMTYQAYVHQLSLQFTNIFLYGLVSTVVASAALAVLVVLGVL